MSTISAGARQELVVAVAERYQTSTAAGAFPISRSSV